MPLTDQFERCPSGPTDGLMAGIAENLVRAHRMDTRKEEHLNYEEERLQKGGIQEEDRPPQVTIITIIRLVSALTLGRRACCPIRKRTSTVRPDVASTVGKKGI